MGKYRLDPEDKTTHFIVESAPDSQGRQRFAILWNEPDGIFRNEPSSLQPEGPVGYRRAQCFDAVLKPYVDDARRKGPVTIEPFRP